MSPLIHDTWASSLTPHGLELYYSGAWHDITDDLSDEGVTIGRGRKNEGGSIDPASMGLRLTNTTGEYAPRNPTSSLYGLIGRNTPIRYWVEAGTPFLDLDGAATATAPDSAGLSITTDVEIQWCGWLPSWRVATDLAGKWTSSGSQRSYALRVNADGTLSFSFSSTGADSFAGTSTQPVPVERGELAVKVTFDQDNGAGGRDYTFYTSPDAGATWVQLGDVVVGGTPVTIFDSTAPLTVGDTDGQDRFTGHVYWVKVLAGIGGTTVADPVFEAQASGASSFADAAGNTWTVNGDAELWNRHYRFWGEVSTWPQEWGLKGATSVTSPIECAGVMRRLGQGASPLRSPLYRGCSTLGADLVAYWPLEDDENATSLAPGITGITGVAAGTITGTPGLAGYSDFVASAPVLTTESARLILPVPAYTAAGEAQVRAMTFIPASLPDDAVIFRVYTSGGSLGRLDVLWDSAGALYTKSYDSSGLAATTGPGFAFDGDVKIRFSLELSQSGSDVDAVINYFVEGETSGFFSTDTHAGLTLGRVTRVEVNPAAAALTGFAVGHVTVEKSVTTLFDLASQVNAWLAEGADDRLARLAAENGVGLDLIGGDTTQALGYQGVASLLDLMGEAAAADGGLLYEPRGSADLAYRALETLYSQRPAVAFTYTDNLLNPMLPVDDDESLVNVATVTRAGGSSRTVEESTGNLGTSTVGTYDTDVTLSLAADEDAEQHAGWRAHLGTTDEARYPTIGCDLAHPTIKADPDLIRSILTLDLGDRLTVTDVPEWLPPDDVDQLVQGYTETITPGNYKLSWNCAPAAPYRVAFWVDGASRYSGSGTEIAEDLDATETGVDVTNPAGVEWTHDDGDYDVTIGGERMTVTGVTGTGTSQTLTVVRSVNGVVKTHSTGAAVALAEPYFWGL